MRNLWAYIAALVVAALVVAFVGGWAWGVRPSPGPVSISPAQCKLDPARLAVPTRPDGRPANYLHTCGGRLYDATGREVQITGLNWSGMETSNYAPDGLQKRSWQEILDQVASLGYSTIRIPFSNEALEPGSKVTNVNFLANPDLEGLSGLEMLDRLVEGARARGLKVILDRHRPTSAGQSDLWYNDTVSEKRWIGDWQMLAKRYAGDDTVIAVDLSNEPRGATTWGSGDPATDWRLAAERAGNAVLAVNPYLLIFVEGIEHYGGGSYWWGGDLRGVATAPVRLKVPGRVVYSPHDYGPAISWQSWFSDPRFPANLPAVWDSHWGYIQRQGIAPVVVGEFGGPSLGDDPDGRWQKALLAYLRQNRIGALAWSLNPSWDTGGILAADWQTVNHVKQAAYQQLLTPPLAVGAAGIFGRAPADVKVLFQQSRAAGQEKDVAFAFRVFNESPKPLDPARVEVRYWIKAGTLTAEQMQRAVEAAEIGGANVRAKIVPTDRGTQDHYLSLTFAPGTQPVMGYRATNYVSVHLRQLDWAQHTPQADYSFADPARLPGHPIEWERVTVYLDGNLVSGIEP